MPTPLDSTLALCLLAALADGAITADEQARIQASVQAMAGAGGGGGPSPDVYQRVMLGQTTIEQEAAALTSEDDRRRAFELAAAVCAADGATSPAEQAFLTRLGAALRLPAPASQATVSEADALIGAALPAAAAGTTAAAATGPAAASALDDLITDHAILAAALELLPHTLASLAIIPLQMRLVYRIGEKHGYTLDRAHIAEFLGVFGIGATSQMFEGAAGRLLGRAVGGALGGLLGAGRGLGGALGRTLGSSALAFATTYALGQVARQYYAGGRKLSAIDLRDLFSSNLGSAQGLYDRFVPQIQSRAGSLNPTRLVSMLRAL